MAGRVGCPGDAVESSLMSDEFCHWQGRHSEKMEKKGGKQDDRNKERKRNMMREIKREKEIGCEKQDEKNKERKINRMREKETGCEK